MAGKRRGVKVRLFRGDCLSILKKQKTDSVKLTLTSPPCNMNLRIRGGKYCSRQIVKEISTKYEGFADNMPMDEYFEFHRDVLTELVRVSDVVFYNIQQVTGNKPALYRLLGHFHEHIKDVIIWDKVNAQPAMQHGVLNSQFEFIFVLQKPEKAIARAFETYRFDRGTLSNVWPIKRGRKVVATHGAVFPEELAEKIVTTFTGRGDVVLDPFMGTGTTGVASIKNGRRFIGMELSKEYLEVAEGRIRSAMGEGVNREETK